jgi:hypothetical protein
VLGAVQTLRLEYDASWLWKRMRTVRHHRDERGRLAVPAPRPYVVAICAISLDGDVADATDHRRLSSDADFDRVDGECSGAPLEVLLAPRFSSIRCDGA